MPRKTRVPLSKDDSAEALFVSDYTCCVCRLRGRRVQIHHIDEDPANNALSNLAVLCLECHDKTQVTGGVGKKLSAALVRKYRHDWLQTVAQQRAKQRGQEAHAPAKRTVRRMTSEQARERAQRLRTLYATFFTGVGYTRDFVVQIDRRLPAESLEARETRLKPIWVEGCNMIDSTLPHIRVEPSSQHVCEFYIQFRTLRDKCMAELVFDHDHPRVLSRLSRSFTIDRMDTCVKEMQAAIHAHIRALDRLS